MARRSGKAANRRARARAPRRPAIPQPRVGTAEAVPRVGTPDAREALTLDPPRPVALRAASAPVSSRLTDRQAAEYHYVGRDLRNIAVLTAVLVLLLAAAAVILPALGFRAG